MLLKCCSQYINKFGKFISGHRTGKSQFSFSAKERQWQRMLKLPHNCTHEWQSTPVLLAWKIPWTEEPGRLQSMGSRRVRHDWATSLSLFTSCIREGNGNPLQCSCLENPRDEGAWWAAVSGVAQSWSQLKWLSSSSRINLQILFKTFFGEIYIHNKCIFTYMF